MLSLARKEFLVILKEKKSRVVIIVPPVIQLVVFGYAATFDLSNVPMAVYNEDRGAASRDLVARFTGSPTFHETARILREEDVRRLIDDGRVILVLHIHPDFTGDLLRGRPANVQVILDGRNSNTAVVALNYARSIVDRFSREWAESQGLRGPPAELEIRSWFNPNLESRWFIVPGIAGVLTLVVTTLLTALSVAREREQGTFDQLLVTPLRPGEVLVGKAVPAFVIGTGEATLIALVAVFWFRVPLLGSVLTLYVGIGLFLLSAIGVGLMISSIAVTQQQGLLGGFLFLVPSITLSGFATPIANMPEVIQWLTYINPARYFMVILRGVFLEGASFHVLVPQFWPLAVIGAVNLVLAAWLFRHRTS
jgi:ABC-2 type transport system permease protein